MTAKKNRTYKKRVIRNTNNVSPKHKGFKREIVTQQSKAQKDLNNKIEKEQKK